MPIWIFVDASLARWVFGSVGNLISLAHSYVWMGMHPPHCSCNELYGIFDNPRILQAWIIITGAMKWETLPDGAFWLAMCHVFGFVRLETRMWYIAIFGNGR